MTIPKAFISYSHDSLEHKKWVLELAIRLRNNGIDAIIDQFELKPGDDIPHFMETNLITATKVLMICTERYVQKANGGSGGVGYEKMVVTSSLLKRIDENKIIPIIRQNDGVLTPTFLGSKLYIDFSKDEDYEFCYDELVRTIHRSPLFQKPTIGNNPFTPVQKEKLEDDIELQDKVLIEIAKIQGLDYSVSSSKVYESLGISAALFRIIMIKLANKDFAAWGLTATVSRVTEKGFLYLGEKNLIQR